MAPLEVNLLLIDAREACGQILESVLDLSDLLVVLLDLLGVLNLELFDFRLDVVKFLFEGLDVGVELVLNFATLLVKLLRLVLNSCGNLVSLLVSTLDTLDRIIMHSEGVVFVEHEHPLDQVKVVVGDLILLVVLVVLKFDLEFDKSARIVSLLLELLDHVSDLTVDVGGHFREDVVVHLLADLLDAFLADVNESLVQALAFDKEHAHAKLKRGFQTDLSDGVLVLLDLSTELLTIIRLLVKEGFNSLVLSEQELELIID